jgi:hypothetical protein
VNFIVKGDRWEEGVERVRLAIRETPVQPWSATGGWNGR